MHGMLIFGRYLFLREALETGDGVEAADEIRRSPRGDPGAIGTNFAAHTAGTLLVGQIGERQVTAGPASNSSDDKTDCEESGPNRDLPVTVACDQPSW
jgi:hypothetical protein